MLLLNILIINLYTLSIGVIFQGAENPLTNHRQYQSSFTCQFNLLLYPFDEQLCYFHLLLSDQTSTAFSNASEVDYLGSKILLEYVINDIAIEVDSINPALIKVSNE